MTGPQTKKTVTQEEQDKVHALKQARTHAAAIRKTEALLAREIRHAQLAGASLREIATATETPYVTIRRMIDEGNAQAS